MVTSTIVRVQRAYACPAEAVYDAWITPELAQQFLFAAPGGSIAKCEITPGVNGRFTIVDRRPVESDVATAIEVEHSGRFLQLDRPRRIAFTFLLPQFQSNETTVILDIEPQGDGCELTLRHDLGPAEDTAELIERAEAGWTRMLTALEKALQSSS
jgi:uncharacterized protein YndB with AHSA1/START domain